MTDNPYSDQNATSDTPKPKKWVVVALVKFFVISGMVITLIAFLIPAVHRDRPAARRTQCKNNLKQISLALHHYESIYGAFPPAFTVDADGKPLHSWRTLILPYLDANRVYEMIDLSKPWNDPANAEACQTVIPGYICPSDVGPPNLTTYLAIVAPNSCFPFSQSRQMSEITDSHRDTMMVIEVNTKQAVHWMSPVDADDALLLSLIPDNKGAHTGGTNALFVDGSVRFLPEKVSMATRRALISISGNDRAGEF